MGKTAIVFKVEFRDSRNLRIIVYPDGSVKITAPAGTSREYIRQFAESKASWIELQQKKFLENKTNKKIFSPENNSEAYVWGVPHKLKIAEHNGYSKIQLEDGCMIMRVRPGLTKIQKLDVLDRFFRNTLKKTAPAVIEKWEKVLGIKVKKLYVRKMKTHWGSCNRAKQSLRLNSELAKLDPEYLEYVIVHEMVHIIVKGHNKEFYRILGKYFPDWKNIRKKMNRQIPV